MILNLSSDIQNKRVLCVSIQFQWNKIIEKKDVSYHTDPVKGIGFFLKNQHQVKQMFFIFFLLVLINFFLENVLGEQEIGTHPH